MDEFDSRLAERLRNMAANVRAPAHLHDRVRTAIADEQRRAVRRRLRRLYGAPALAVLAATVAFLLIQLPGFRSEPDLTPLTSLQLASNEVELRDWFYSLVGYEVTIPEIEDAELIGGRIEVAGDLHTAAVSYTFRDVDLTYLVTPSSFVRDHRVSDGEAPYLVRDGDSKMVVWGTNGFARALVGRLSDDELMSIALKCRSQELARSAGS